MTDTQAGDASTVTKSRWSIPIGSKRWTLPLWFQNACEWVLGLPLAALVAIGAAILAGFIAFVLFIGFALGKHQVFPAAFFDKVDNKLANILVGEREVPKLASTTYDSALIKLDASIAIVPTGRVGKGSFLSRNGGGMTSFGDDVLLLPYNGKIYAASNPDTLRETNLVAPDNKREEYIEAADLPENQDLNFSRGYLRYNDISYFNNSASHGLIASYTEYHVDDKCVTNTLARLDFESGVTSIDDVEASDEDWTIIYRTTPCLPFKTRHTAMEGHMAGGRIAFMAPSTIYLTSGDFHWDGMRSEGAGIAQDPDAQYGKVLQVDIETGVGSIMSMGHRNMQGITLSADNDVLVIEHGPKGGDEMNRIEQGKNYGWPLESYGTTYRGSPMPNSISFGRHTQSEPPIFSWIPSIAASSVTRVEGFNEAWDGDYLVAALTDRSLHRVRLEGDRAVYSERIEIGTRIRDIHQHSDGQLVAWTDNEELMFFSGRVRVDTQQRFENYLTNANLSSRLENRLRTAVDGCAECHSFIAGEHNAAPSLGRIFGDEIASTEFSNYSDALKKKRGTWTRENLIAYISDPNAFAPGTIMPNPSLDDENTIDAVVEYLLDIEDDF